MTDREADSPGEDATETGHVDGSRDREADAGRRSADGEDGAADGAAHERDPAATADRPADVPTWEDEYLDRVSGNLMFNYDLEKDIRVDGERFDLAGTLRLNTHKQFFHPALSYGHQRAFEYLFAKRVDRPTVGDLDRLVDLGHRLADERVEADEEHYSTEFVFVLVAAAIPEEVREYVASFTDRTMLKYGYHGRYELGLAVVAPEREEAVASPAAEVATAFELWDEEREKRGLLGRLFGALGR